MHYEFVMHCYTFNVFIYCGGGGNRTHVRVKFSNSIYMLSLFLVFNLKLINKQTFLGDPTYLPKQIFI